MPSSTKRAVILGNGVSGKASASLLETLNTTYRYYSDNKNSSGLREKEVLPTPEELRRFITLDTPDFAVVSPGFDPKHPAIQALKDHSVPMHSELNLARRFYRGKVLGITGTNGKTTAALMTAHILNAHGISAIAAGNTGTPLSAVVLRNSPPPEVVVLEISSYQLHWSVNLRLEAAAITSLAPDHLKWHGGLMEYYAAKVSIAQHTNIVYLPDAVRQITKENKFNFSNSVIDIETDVPFSTAHDRCNASLAMNLCGRISPIPKDSQISSMTTFEKPDFRFQKRQLHSHTIINDSKSTNCASTAAALSSIEQPCLLLLGGLDKGESFSGLVEHEKAIGEIWLFGKSADRLEPMLRPWARLVKFATLKEALDKLRHRLSTTVNETVLFSPGCASQDEFADFIQRGSFFNEALAETTPLESAATTPLR